MKHEGMCPLRCGWWVLALSLIALLAQAGEQVLQGDRHEQQACLGALGLCDRSLAGREGEGGEKGGRETGHGGLLLGGVVREAGES